MTTKEWNQLQDVWNLEEAKYAQLEKLCNQNDIITCIFEGRGYLKLYVKGFLTKLSGKRKSDGKYILTNDQNELLTSFSGVNMLSVQDKIIHLYEYY